MALQYDLTLDQLMDFFCDGAHQGFSQAEIQAAEARLGVSLPDTYRSFLARYGRDPVTVFFNQL